MTCRTGLFVAVLLAPTVLDAQEVRTVETSVVRVSPLVTANHSIEEYRFVLAPDYGSRFETAFRVIRPGIIRLEAKWEGEARQLALILNGPAQTNAFAREDASSPLVIEFEVDEDHADWSLEAVCDLRPGWRALWHSPIPPRSTKSPYLP